ncbi:MFS transporter [Actinocrispum wychmicini]|uniref:Putative MFS family arabinose efflux permease n=1 Tax=Actinocrispum wychmicini TaxID=1213861 RepID=A0A4R2JX38_9PSEU|nr:MFS transporter [Actinocrispum wychmicini]TCO64424.1 putative MFS family arabinose efflux permease [Actinocrispum wychmicini]
MVDTRALLRGNPAFRALVASRAVSFVGDGITATVLVLLAAQQNGPAGVGLLLFANALPRFGGPLAGVFVDRVQTRKLMMSCELTSALVIGLVAVALPPLPVLIPLVALAGVLATIRNPAGRSLVPVLVDQADRAPANALFALGRTLQLAVGPGLGGLLAAAPGGIHTALAVDAATFVASALLLSGLPAFPAARDPAAVTGMWAEAAAGLRYVATHRQVRVLVLALFLTVAFAAVDNVALVFLTSDRLHAGAAGYGFAASAFGVGMLLASVACTRLARGRSPLALLVLATAATGVGMILTGLAPAVAVVVAAQLIAGAGNAGENIGYDTVVQNLVARQFLGRVFGTFGTAAQLGAGLAYISGGVLVSLVGARAAFVVAGAGTFAVLLILAPVLRRNSHDRFPQSPKPTSTT